MSKMTSISLAALFVWAAMDMAQHNAPSTEQPPHEAALFLGEDGDIATYYVNCETDAQRSSLVVLKGGYTETRGSDASGKMILKRYVADLDHTERVSKVAPFALAYSPSLDEICSPTGMKTWPAIQMMKNLAAHASLKFTVR